MTTTISVPPAAAADAALIDSGTRLRMVTMNIHKGLSTTNRKSTVHLLRERLRVLHPDLVFAQEVQEEHSGHKLRFPHWPEAEMSHYLAADFWEERHYGRNAVYDHGHHGNAILSRHPVLGGANHDISEYKFERRGLLHTEIRLPHMAHPLHCFCIHLALLQKGRTRQLEAIVAHVTRLVPEGAPVILAGDFNDWRKRASLPLERAGFAEVFETLHGKCALTFPSQMPVLPLDRIYVRNLKPRSARVLRDWSALSDHLGLWAEFDLPPG
jgi:endonuclease/exonuclease/phosphatase family metal-dependent hydrolase